MATYNLENNIDFYAELYKQLDSDNLENKDNNCLITNMPLTDKFVELECGHKFNYEPLYNDVKNHKQKFNNMEAYTSRLKYNELRCPYCRTKSNVLLPYYEELGLEKISGVNFINNNYDPDHPYKKCEFTILCNQISIATDLESPPTSIIKCPHMGTQINYTQSGFVGGNYGDEKYYCYKHKKVMTKTYKKQILDKKKEELKLIHLSEKQKKKEEKESIIKQKKGIIPKNVILCDAILQNGSNKGKLCGCKAVSETRCKRHYKKNINTENIIIENTNTENMIIENISTENIIIEKMIIENNIVEK